MNEGLIIMTTSKIKQISLPVHFLATNIPPKLPTQASPAAQSVGWQGEAVASE